MSQAGECSLKKPFQATKKGTICTSKFFLPSEDAEDLWNALQASTTDTTAIINILANRTLSQRLLIINEYKRLHSADLVSDLTEKLSGDFETLIVAMMTPLDQYFAEELHYAMEGAGTDERKLIEILCTVNNDEILAIRRAYHSKYDVYLENDLVSETSSHFLDILVALCRTERDESQFPDYVAAKTDAESLYNATSETRWGVFVDILVHRSYAQLKVIFDEYAALSVNGIEQAIQEYFSGDGMDALLAIVGTVTNPAKYFAQELNKSVAGLGTNDRDLIRLVVTRSEIDMAEIKTEYAALYSETLAAAIADDTSGDYKTCLLALIGEPENKK